MEYNMSESVGAFLSIQWPRYQTKISESIERVWRFIIAISRADPLDRF